MIFNKLVIGTVNTNEGNPDGGLVVTGTVELSKGFLNFIVPMKTAPSNILPHLQHFLKPVNATPQNMSSESIHCLNLTLQICGYSTSDIRDLI